MAAKRRAKKQAVQLAMNPGEVVPGSAIQLANSEREYWRQREKKTWTVAVYMVADGPGGSTALDALAERELSDIIATADPEDTPEEDKPIAKIHVAVQLDLKMRKGIRRVVVGRHDELFREQDSADPDTLDQFVHWVHWKCPADHYVFIFWGHSSGPAGLFLDRLCNTCAAKVLPIQKAQRALAQVGPQAHVDSLIRHATHHNGTPRPRIDLVMFKDCWIDTLEVAFQLKDTAKFMIASQAIVPTRDWPYKKMFDCLTAMVKAKKGESSEGEPKAVATAFLDVLGDFYDRAKNRPGRDEVPFALLDLSKAQAIEKPLGKFVEKLRAAPRDWDLHLETRDALASASRGDPALLDVMAMSKNLQELARRKGPEAAALMKASTDLMRAATTLISAPNGTAHRRPEASAFGGVSIFYYPKALQDQRVSFISPITYPTEYRKYTICDKTKWDRVALENMPDEASTGRPQKRARGILIIPGGEADGRLIASDVSFGSDTGEKSAGFSSDTGEKSAGFSSDTGEKSAGFGSDTGEKSAGFGSDTGEKSAGFGNDPAAIGGAFISDRRP